MHKPTFEWRNKSLRGQRLSWVALHPKAQTFLFTEGTLQKVSEDNADYARALVQGLDLQPWHNRVDWQTKEATKKVQRGVVLDPVEAGIAMMANQARETTKRSNGQEVVGILKNKNFGFLTDDELRCYLRALIKDQEGLCAISGIRLQYPGELDDHELQCSLDRISSDGHYEPGNLQVICKFLNRWKSDSKDADFRRLLTLVQSTNGFESIE